MPGLCYQNDHQNSTNAYADTCKCNNCPCKNNKSKRFQNHKNILPPNAIVFQLPKYREPRNDTYSHTVYKKEFCNSTLMKQHALLARRKTPQRSKKPPVLEKERFECKTTTATDYRRYNCKESAVCKNKFPRVKRKEDFYFPSGEYSCAAEFPRQSVSHGDYSPQMPVPSVPKRVIRKCDLPPFEGMSCYKSDFNVPPAEAYSKSKVPRKRTIFN